MVINCEVCLKKYLIDPNQMSGHETGFNCRGCGQHITVLKSSDGEPPIVIQPESPGHESSTFG